MKAQGGGWTKLQPVEISKHHPDYEEPEKMKFFIGDETNTNRFNWLPNPDLSNNSIFIDKIVLCVL